MLTTGFGGKPNQIGNQGVLLWLRLEIKKETADFGYGLDFGFIND